MIVLNNVFALNNLPQTSFNLSSSNFNYTALLFYDEFNSNGTGAYNTTNWPTVFTDANNFVIGSWNGEGVLNASGSATLARGFSTLNKFSTGVNTEICIDFAIMRAMETANTDSALYIGRGTQCNAGAQAENRCLETGDTAITSLNNNDEMDLLIGGTPTRVNTNVKVDVGTSQWTNITLLVNSDGSSRMWINNSAANNVSNDVTAGITASPISIMVRHTDKYMVRNIYAYNCTKGFPTIPSAVTDTTSPIVNTTLNNTAPTLYQWINFTGNVTDETGLLYGNWTYNISGSITKLNYSLSGTSAQISNITQLNFAGVFNFTLFVTDTSNNVKQNSTLITVLDNIFPIVNTTFNITSPKVNDVINFSGNVTDETGLLSANWTYNLSGSLTKLNYTLSGTSAQVSNITTLTCIETCVTNFTLYVTDTSNNVKQNSTLITVADATPPVVNVSINNTNPKKNEFINITSNNTDGITLKFVNITINFSTGKLFMNYSVGGVSTQISNATQITDSRGNTLNITVYATDWNNNVRQNSTLITVASTSLNGTTITNLTNQFTNKNLTLNWTPANNPDGVTPYYLVYYNLSGQTVLLSNTSQNNVTINLTNQGNYSIFVNVSDNVNVTSGGLFYLVYDATPPTFVGAFNRTTLDNTTSITTATNVNLSLIGLDDLYLTNGNFSENASKSWVNHSITIIGNNTPYYYLLSFSNFSANQVVGWKFYVYDTAGNILDPIYTFTVGDVSQKSSSTGGGSAGGGGFTTPLANPFGIEPVNNICPIKQQLLDEKCYPCDPDIGYLRFNPEDRSIVCVSCSEGFIMKNGTCTLKAMVIIPAYNKINMAMDDLAKKISRLFKTENPTIGFFVIFVSIILLGYYGLSWLVKK